MYALSSVNFRERGMMHLRSWCGPSNQQVSFFDTFVIEYLCQERYGA